MKFIKILEVFLLSVVLSKKNGHRKTPQGVGLSNHFGSDALSSEFGQSALIPFGKIEYRDSYGHI